MLVSWFSTGVSSFIATYLMRDKVDKIIYTHVANQHPDSLRFVKDCEKALGKEIIILQSDKFKSIDDVFMATGMLNTPYGAPCTRILKKNKFVSNGKVKIKVSIHISGVSTVMNRKEQII